MVGGRGPKIWVVSFFIGDDILGHLQKKFRQGPLSPPHLTRPPLSLRLDYMKSQRLYRERKIGIFPSPRANIKEGIGIVPCLIAYMGGKRGIFPSPSAYIEGNRLEFFQVPEPV